MSTIYRDRDRYDDSRTTVSSGRRDGGYTTVKRYIVKDDDTRSNYGRSDRRIFPERAGERVEETRIVRREREVDEPVREPKREEPRYSSEQLTIRRDEREDDRRSYYEPRREQRSDDREEIVIRRTKEVDEPRREEPRRDAREDLTVARIDDRRESTQIVRKDYRDDYEVLSPTRGGFEDRDLTKYTRQTDYYAPAPPPQTIIIRQEPIIIRERVRDDDYVSVRRSDVDEEKSIVRRGRTPDPPRRGEEDYFYEKKVRERIDEPRDRDQDDEWRDRRMMRREVSPHDSVSQVGGRSRNRRSSYSSDDSMVYVKRTKEGYSSDEEPRNKKNLAAGVIAGIGAAELLRNHKQKEGRETSHGIGRIGRDVGAGALGAIAAEGIQRARSRYRSKSRRRSRGRSDSRSRSRSRRRSRSRSESRSKLKTWGAVGLGAAALAAAAAIAQKKMGNRDKEASPNRGRSHSRGRQESVAELANDPNAPSDDARNPKHRNIRMAEAGAAGAAITALIDRARSKSRGRNESRSKIRQAVPIVAAGLGSAALAGLYEKNKAKNEAEDISKTDRRDRRASRSRSRQRSEYSDYPRESVQGAANPMIEYGDGPMHGNNYGREYYPGADQYGRPPNQEGYYANQTAVVPAEAAAAAAGYGAAQGGRARSLSGDRRSRSRSLSSSPGGHRRRHRHSRSRSGARDAAAAGGVGAAAMAEHERKERKRERRARKHQEQYGDPYEDTFNPHGYAAPTPPVDPYAAQNQPGYYPQTSQFPPPPGTVPQQYPAQPAAVPPGAAYSAEYPPPPPGAPPAPGYDHYASGANPYAPRRGADEQVSVPPNPTFSSDRSFLPDGMSTPRGPAVTANPSINVYPPSISTPPNSNVDLNVPLSSSYIPPTDRSPSPSRTRATSQPPPNGPRKSVAFAEKPEVKTVADSEASNPEQHRHRRHREHGYEAGDDTDSTPDDQRRRSQRDRADESTRPLDPISATGDDGQKKRHRRRRSHDPSSATASSSRTPDRNQTTSPAESDATVDLPTRFDSKGNKKTETGDDPLADRIDGIMKGKGATGKIFGNFIDGIFGPDGRRKSVGRDR